MYVGKKALLPPSSHFQKWQQLKINCFVSPFLLALYFSLVSAGEVYVPCKLDSAYSNPFMVFTWLLLKRAKPNSWEKTEQEIALHGGHV